MNYLTYGYTFSYAPKYTAVPIEIPIITIKMIKNLQHLFDFFFGSHEADRFEGESPIENSSYDFSLIIYRIYNLKYFTWKLLSIKFQFHIYIKFFTN